MSAAQQYADRVDAWDAQRARVLGRSETADRWARGAARRFRFDPRRALDPNLAAVAAYLTPDDVFVDVGGGAGRVCLPLALRCREVVNVDPSPAMGEEFTASAAEAGISNARLIPSDWLAAEGVTGDVIFAANVTYFVREIERFVARMEAAARRRVIISVWSVPPPDQDAALFERVHGEPQARVPGHAELLPVLWEMGILPDVQVLPNALRLTPPARDREEAIEQRAQSPNPEVAARTRALLRDHFDELFRATPAGYEPLWRPASRELLITWEPGAATDPRGPR